MFGFRLACLLVRFLRAFTARPVALLYDPTEKKIIAWARASAANDFDVGTASVNLQRGCGGQHPMKNRVILTSDPPKIICLGTAALTGITDVIHVSETGTLTTYKPGNDATPAAAYQPPRDPKYPSEIAAWIDASWRCIAESRTNDFLVAFGKVPPLGTWPSLLLNVIDSSEVSPVVYFPPKAPDVEDTVVSGRNPAVDSFWMAVARRLVGLVHVGANKVSDKMRRGHNIGCILVDANNHILAWGVNTLGNNPTHHAETKCMWMFQHYHPNLLVPEGATLYTTLESCLMCSATIKHACGRNNVRVVYAEEDKVQNSVLTQPGGAVEIHIADILTGPYFHLCRQHFILAKARWDLIRRAIRAGLFRGLETLPDRDDLEARIVDLERTDPEVRAAQDAVKAILAGAGLSQLTGAVFREILKGAQSIARAKGEAATDEAKRIAAAAIEQAMSGKDPDLVRRVVAEFLNRAARYGAQLNSLRAQRQAALVLQGRAMQLPYNGGAPVLLLNPVGFEPLYQMAVIARVGDVDPRTRILDISTQIHGLNLLMQVINEVPTYGRH